MTSLDKHSIFYNGPNMWSDVLENLRNKMSLENFKGWIAPLVLSSLEDETVHLKAQDDFAKSWVEDNYLDLIEDALAEVIGQQITVKITSSNEAKEKTSSQNDQLILWPTTERAAPNAFLRSALFGPISRGPRKQYKELTEMSSYGDLKILYKGEQLDQGDLDVWFQAIELHRPEQLGQSVTFTIRGFLKQLGRRPGGSGNAWLKRSIQRMYDASILIETKNWAIESRLIYQQALKKHHDTFSLRLNPDWARPFLANDYTRLHWETRQNLPAANYAQWLHGFLSTHDFSSQKPLKIGINKLKPICGGAAISNQRKFRQKLRAGLDELKDVGFISAWDLDKRDIVTIG